MPRKYTDAEKVAYYKRKAAGGGGARARRPAQGRAKSSYASRKGTMSYKYPGVGKYIGSAIGSFAGNAISPGIGGAIGGGIGGAAGQAAHYLTKRITGFGDYNVSKNSLVYNRDSIPEFSNNNERCTVITHREFVQDILSSTTFVNSEFRINPTISQTFPWLSAISQNYEQYVVQGMVFEFKTTSATAIGSTNTALGTVVMATQYNSLSPAFDNKAQMENYEFSQSTIPSQSVLHAIECDPTQTQCGGVFNCWSPNAASGDLRLYDLGRFNIATVGMQSANIPIGELWVTYKICLLKPRLTGQEESGDLFYLDVNSLSSGNPLGTISLVQNAQWNSGIVTFSTTNTIIIDPSYVGLLQIIYGVEAPVAVTACELPLITCTGNCEDVSTVFTGISGLQTVMNVAAAAQGYSIYYVKCNGGYVPSTGAPPKVLFTGMVLTGGLLGIATLTCISMPANMAGTL